MKLLFSAFYNINTTSKFRLGIGIDFMHTGAT